jgi:hypothetical protein
MEVDELSLFICRKDYFLRVDVFAKGKIDDGPIQRLALNWVEDHHDES